MQNHIRLLLVEDNADDAILLVHGLKKAGFDLEMERVDTQEGMRRTLQAQTWDIIIADYAIPGFGGLEALRLVQSLGLDVPFILVSGHMGEEIAVMAMKAGAHDYVMKDKLARLAPAIDRELREAEVRRARKQAEADLAVKAVELQNTVEDLRKVEAELRDYNEQLQKARAELEARVQERTADLKAAYAELQCQMEARQRLENELLELTEQERRRIGLDLHDELGQHLHGVVLMLQAVQVKLSRQIPVPAAEVERIKDQLLKVIHFTHDLAHDLASLDAQLEDVRAALQNLSARIQTLFEISCELSIDENIPPLPANAVTHLYKIAQEAATNAIRHGQARRIQIHLNLCGERLALKVRNNGKPFPKPISLRDHMGLRIMNYRANVLNGSFDIQSDEFGWTEVSCGFPVPA